jgi:hypothetical protein
MSKIEIPFNDWSKDKLRRGIKTATTRSKKYGEPGDTFEVRFNLEQHERFSRVRTYELVSITRKSLANVAERHFKEEGAESPQEFIEVWNDTHPRRKFRSQDIKYFHRFKEVQ